MNKYVEKVDNIKTKTTVTLETVLNQFAGLRKFGDSKQVNAETAAAAAFALSLHRDLSISTGHLVK